MHELAHIICEHQPDRQLELNGIGLPLRDHDPEHEAEAEWLGACLQIPREGLLWALRKGMKPSEIAEHYKASLKMTNYRIGITGAKIQIERARRYY